MTIRGRLTFLAILVSITALAAGYLSVEKAGPIVQAASSDVAPVEDPTTTTVVPTTVPTEVITTTLAPTTTTIATTTTVARSTTTHTHAPSTTTAAVVTVPTTRAVPVTVTTMAARASTADPICNYILIDISAQTLSADCTDEDYTMPISSGSEVPYCENGVCGDAITYRGTFKVHRMDPGYEEAPLGTIYNGIYFNGGIAIHGGHLPGYPASHGCVRIHYPDADWLFERVRVGVTVVKVQD